MPLFHDDEIREQQRIRRALLANGYSPLAQNGKRPYWKGWSKLPITPEIIDRWEGVTEFRSTGLRCDNGLLAIDIDINDKTMSRRAVEVLIEVAPHVEGEFEDEDGVYRELLAPERSGRGDKLCLLFRRDPEDTDKTPISVMRSTGHVRPGEDPDDPDLDAHRVEVFGSSGQQIGAFGPHSLNPDGSVAVEYRWPYGGPLETPLTSLPVLTHKQVKDFIVRMNEEMVAAGWPRILLSKTMVDGYGEPQYILTDDMTFDCLDGATRTLQEMYQYALQRDPEPRCSAAWFEGPQAKDRNRTKVNLIGPDDDKRLELIVFNVGRFRPVVDRPVPISEKASIVAVRLKELGIDLDDLPEEAEQAFKDAYYELVHEWAYDVLDTKTPVAHLFDGTALSTKNAEAMFPGVFHTDPPGPKGGKGKTYTPYGKWAASRHRKVIYGRKFRPDLPRGIFTDNRRPVLNSYRPPEHLDTHGPNPALAEVFLRFVEHLIPDEAPREWFLDRLAHKVQYPMIPGVATLFYSPTFGTGRDTLFKIIAGVVGDHNAIKVEDHQLRGDDKFTGWMSNKLIGYVPEILQSGNDGAGAIAKRHKDYERLKQLFEPSGRNGQIEKKGVDPVTQSVCVSFFLATNHENALTIPEHDRRIVVIDGTRTKLADTTLRGEVYAQFTMGGAQVTPAFAAAVWHWLQARDVSAFDPIHAPDWGGKAAMIEANKTPLDTLAENMLNDWPTDWVELNTFIERFTDRAVRQKLTTSGSLSATASNVLGRLWPNKTTCYLKHRRKITAYCRTFEETVRLSQITTEAREAELTLQQQLIHQPSAELRAARLGIAEVKTA